MAILVFLYKLELRLIYFLFKLLPVAPHKVVFLSRNFDSPPLDFRLLETQLKSINPDVKTVFLTKRIHKNIFSLIGYHFHTIRQLYHIATTNVCVLDSYIIPISILNHRKTLKVIQIWHAMGAIKKFGYQTLGFRYGRKARLSRLMHMHEKYDHIISGSPAMIPFFCKAFNAPESIFLPYGLPRIDYIVNTSNGISRRIKSKYPELSDKPVILYVPTFRLEQDGGIEELVNQIDFDKYTLIIRKHPNDKRSYNDERVAKIDGFSALELLTVADYVITDYSAISIEAAALEKRVYLYVYDYARYFDSNGLNIDLSKELPGCVFGDAAALMDDIKSNSYDQQVIRSFRDKYVINKGDSTQKICRLISSCMKEDPAR
ncbi:MAG: CDP-glycerol glycerophosphotransferase family protein [Oscillospiraceae bacterium]|nr:CDP-glycerol glycerophosphotransferase family protein [Oscillospiraceae bacterium]MDD3833195.1 CDP-glycerol glycerophosphotransferase family protein [Oscillospiraceae bacterium]MDD4546274.1 CDP-glycerol glycerophosphotransferase family protein [Oscillospiraceae bacterium]